MIRSFVQKIIKSFRIPKYGVAFFSVDGQIKNDNETDVESMKRRTTTKQNKTKTKDDKDSHYKTKRACKGRIEKRPWVKGEGEILLLYRDRIQATKDIRLDRCAFVFKVSCELLSCLGPRTHRHEKEFHSSPVQNGKSSRDRETKIKKKKG